MRKKFFIIAGVIVALAALFVLQDIFLAPPDKKFFFHKSPASSTVAGPNQNIQNSSLGISNASNNGSPELPSGEGISYQTASPNSTVQSKDGASPTMQVVVNQKYAGQFEYAQNVLDFSKLKPYPPVDPGNPTAHPQPTDKFITANFIDFSQINYIHKFRACHGHDYYGPDYDRGSEPLSAMKMYLKPIDSLEHTNDKVKIFAPFDGVIAQVDPTDTARGRHYMLMREPFNGWYMTFFHQTFNDKDLHVGTRVKAGQFLSYATTSDIGNDFDIALQRFDSENGQYNGQWTTYNYQTAILKNLEPILPHMTDQVAAQWKAHGVAANDTITSKEYREAHPCACYGGAPGTTECYFRIPDPEKVWIKQ